MRGFTSNASPWAAEVAGALAGAGSGATGTAKSSQRAGTHIRKTTRVIDRLKVETHLGFEEFTMAVEARSPPGDAPARQPLAPAGLSTARANLAKKWATEMLSEDDFERESDYETFNRRILRPGVDILAHEFGLYLKRQPWIKGWVSLQPDWGLHGCLDGVEVLAVPFEAKTIADLCIGFGKDVEAKPEEKAAERVKLVRAATAEGVLQVVGEYVPGTERSEPYAGLEQLATQQMFARAAFGVLLWASAMLVTHLSVHEDRPMLTVFAVGQHSHEPTVWFILRWLAERAASAPRCAPATAPPAGLTVLPLERHCLLAPA